MFKNYFISAIRSITKNKFYSFLNILGLTIGLVAFIFIFIYVRDELTYDKYHKEHDRIYRLESDFTVGSKQDRFAVVPIPMGPALQLEYPEVESVVRFHEDDNILVRIGDREYYEDDFYYTDSTIFDVFTHELVMGELDGSLTEPNTAVLTNKIAEKYFGKENPIGQVIETGGDRQFKITAVIEDLPTNSHLRFHALLSAATLAKQMGDEDFNSMEPVRFWSLGAYTYVLLNKSSSIESIHEKFPDFYGKYMKSVGDQINASFNLLTTPLAHVHLSSNLAADLPTGNKAYVFIFSAVAVFILLLAVINYMNMATARSSVRSREVGMRKVMGAEKSQLIIQFLSESVVLAIIALALALLCVYILFPDFNNLTGKELSFDLIMDPFTFLQIFLIAVIIGLLSGSYPAFFLSSFMPLNALKGMVAGSGKTSLLMRRGLVAFQLFIAIVIIISTLVVSDQISFLKNKDLGFDKENVVVLQLQDSAFRSKFEAFKETLKSTPSILNASNSTGIPGENRWIQVMRIEQESKMTENTIILTQCDYDYNKTMGFKIVKGRDFDKKMGTDDTAAVIINEMAARQFGWEADPIGKKIHYGFGLDGSGGRIMKVIGVVKDYHFNSLHNKIEPIIHFVSSYPRSYLTVRVEDGKMNEALAHIEESWMQYNSKRPFDYRMLNEIQEDMYQGEEKINIIFIVITSLTVFIALLGLFGLSSFTTEQRTHEIGIRKVNGATVGDILLLLYREFFWLLLIGFVVAIPVAWWRLNLWLEASFIYYVDIKWYTILFAGGMTFLVGFATISYHVIRAASRNPADAIKYE